MSAMLSRADNLFGRRSQRNSARSSNRWRSFRLIPVLYPSPATFHPSR